MTGRVSRSSRSPTRPSQARPGSARRRAPTSSCSFRPAPRPTRASSGSIRWRPTRRASAGARCSRSRRVARWIWSEKGTILFKAEASAWTPRAVQLQQVWVDPEVRGQGYAQRGLRDLVRLLLERVPRVCLFVRADNPAAIRLYEAIGMARVGTYRRSSFSAPPGSTRHHLRRAIRLRHASSSVASIPFRYGRSLRPSLACCSHPGGGAELPEGTLMNARSSSGTARASTPPVRSSTATRPSSSG